MFQTIVQFKKTLMHVLPYNLQDIFTLSLFIYIYVIKKNTYILNLIIIKMSYLLWFVNKE